MPNRNDSSLNFTINWTEAHLEQVSAHTFQTCVRVSYQLGETDALLVGQVNEILEEFTSYKVSSSDVLISNCHSGIDTVGTLQQNRPYRAVHGCKELPRLLSIPMVNHRADLGY